MSYTIKWYSKSAIWHFSDTVTGTDIIQSHLDVYGNARFDDMIYKIVNFSDVDSFQVKPDDVKRVAYFDMAAAKINKRVKMAVIAPSEDSKKLTEEYLSYVKESHWPMQIFDSMDAVEDWIGESKSYQI